MRRERYDRIHSHPLSPGNSQYRQVAYIDTEGTFRPDRIKAIAERFGIDPEAALENILYSTLTSYATRLFHALILRSARAYNSENQFELIQECASRFADEKVYKLLVCGGK